MADKTLRIIFNGISTLYPGPPRKGDEPPDEPPDKTPDKEPKKAFVMMAANVDEEGKRGPQTNAWRTTIPEHFPFVHVRRSLLVDPPDPDETVIVSDGGEHFIYFFKDARVRIDPPPRLGTPIEYSIDPKRPLAERPGSDNVAPPSDIRWLADIRDILSEPVPLKKTANPAEPYVSEEVAAVVDLDGGQLKANFPCASVVPKTFKDKKTDKTVAGLRRVLADEFIIDIPYPEDTDQITLEFKELREGTPVEFPQLKKGKPVKEPNKLVIDWPKKQERLDVRMGNDTKGEVRRLDTPERCDPLRQTGPVLKPRDDDFDLHYNFLEIPKDAGRPLPQNDVQQCSADGCKPAAIRVSVTKGGGK